MTDELYHSLNRMQTAPRVRKAVVVPCWLRPVAVRLVVKSGARLSVATVRQLLSECRNLLSTFTGLARDVALSQAFQAVPALEWQRSLCRSPHLKR